ncbi:MAG: hypothetical protein HOW73_51375 [Polyangiaceae bacterium]|nr:hypothetical protein [Polyangiaceae bacterium]
MVTRPIVAAARAASPGFVALDAGESSVAAALACAASAFAHLVVAAAFAALWIAPWKLEEEKRAEKKEPPPPDPITWVEAAELEPGTDVPVADQVEPSKEQPAEEAAAAPAPPVEAVAPEVAAAPPAPVAKLESVVDAHPHYAVRGPSQDLVDHLTEERVAVLQASPEIGIVGSRAGTGGGTASGNGTAGTSVDAATTAREKAPDLAARFTKELPRYAADIEGWTTLTVGTLPATEFTIELGDDGRVVRPTEEQKPPDEKRAALTLSVTRTLRSLVTKLALPGLPVQAGSLRVKVKATISDGAPREAGDEIELSFTYDGKARKGAGTFVLRSGRTVTFDVEVVAVEPKDPPAEAPASDASEPPPSPSSSASASAPSAQPAPSASAPPAKAPDAPSNR